MRYDHILLTGRDTPALIKERYETRLPEATPRIYLACGSPAPEWELIEESARWLTDATGSFMGLSVSLPGTLDNISVRKLHRAGFSFLEVAFSSSSAEAFDRRAATPGASEHVRRWLARLMEEQWADRSEDGSRSFPFVRLEARLALDPVSSDGHDAFDGFFRRFGRILHRVQLELWPRKTRRGVPVVAPFHQLTGALVHVLRNHAGRWGEDWPSIGVQSDTGLPLCLLAAHPDLLPYFRLTPGDCRPLDKKGALPSPPCRACAVAKWCSSGRKTGGGPGGVPLEWEAQLSPFSRLPEGLIARADGDSPDAGSRNALYAPRMDPQHFAAIGADSALWETACLPRVHVTPADALGTSDRAPLFPVLLVRLPGYSAEERESSTAFPPLSLIRLGSILSRAGFPVAVVDLAAEAASLGLLGGHDEATMEEMVNFCRGRLEREEQRSRGFAMLAMSVDTGNGLAIARQLLATTQLSTFCVIGGRGVPDGASLLRVMPQLDFAVEGEGDAALLALCSILAQRREPRAVPGLSYRHAGTTVRMPAAHQDLNLIAPPVLDWVRRELYRDAIFPFNRQDVVPYLFVRGCPYHCAYCADYTAGNIRLRDPVLVADDIQVMVEEYGYNKLLFLNTLINSSPRYLSRFLTVMEERGLDFQWADSAKAVGLSGRDLGRLRERGCIALTWGIDSASRRMSALMRKGIDLDAAAGILRESHDAGISNVVNLIVGLPHEGSTDVEETKVWLEAHRPFVSHINLMEYIHFPASLIYRYPDRWNLRPVGERGFDEIGGLKWSEKQKVSHQAWQMLNRVVVELGYRRTTGSDS